MSDQTEATTVPAAGTTPDPAAIAAATVAPAAAVIPAAATAAPATPVVPAASAEHDDKGSARYAPTGDSTLDVALGFVGRLGISADSAEMQAAATGDFGLLKAKLASLGAKAQGWEQFVSLGESAFTKHQATQVEKEAESRTLVVATVGGEDNWAQISEWAKGFLPAEEKGAINALLTQGGIAAKAAAALLASTWQSQADTVIEATPAASNMAAQPARNGGALSPDQYRIAVRDLTAKGEATQAAIAELDRRRLAYHG